MVGLYTGHGGWVQMVGGDTDHEAVAVGVPHQRQRGRGIIYLLRGKVIM